MEALLSKRGSLHVLGAAELLGLQGSLFVSDGTGVAHGEAVERVAVVAEVNLGAGEDNWNIGAVVANLGDPLVGNIVERRGVDDREHGEEDVGLGVGEGTEAVILLLASSVPEAVVNGLVVNHHVAGEHIKHRRHVVRRESVLGVGDQEAGLANSAITNNNELNSFHESWRGGEVKLLSNFEKRE